MLKPLFKDIADAIREKEGSEGKIPAETFPARIRAISTGSKPGLSAPLDPVQVYQDTRPADWLPMPEPQDDEMYLLFHIPDGVSSLLAFTVTCTGSYTVALGTVTNGAFVQQSATSVASGIKYEAELFADDYGGLTSDGMKQVMVKVSGGNIKTWEPSAHSKKASPSGFSAWSIVEISCRLPEGTSVRCGYYSSGKALMKLRYFSWNGKNKVTDMSYKFYNCYSLTAIPQLDTANVTNMSSMFYYCYSLTAIPQLDTANVTDMKFMFYYCYSLTAIPQLDTAQVTNMSRMFANCNSLTAIPQLDTAQVTDMSMMFCYCNSLTAIPQLDTAQVTDMSMMFYYCNSLTAIPQLDTAQVTDMSDMFNNCYSLTILTLDPTIVGWAGYAISLSNCSLGHQALVDLFNSLPTITSTKELTITYNPGVSELTDAEKKIATNKNWTLTL